MCRPYKAQLKLTSTLKLPTMVYLPLPPAPSFLLHKPHSHSHPIKRANPAPPTTTTTTTTPTPTLKAKMLVRSISLPELGFRPSARSLPPLNGGHDRRPASAPPSPHPGNDFEELEEEEEEKLLLFASNTVKHSFLCWLWKGAMFWRP
jgi:hypothetical protein